MIADLVHTNTSRIDAAKWLRYAYREAAEESPDPSTQNSAVLVDPDMLAGGFAVADAVNRFPDGVAYTEARWERPLKYQIIEHAERNVIYAAAKAGIRTGGLVMVSPWAACPDCARGIIQSGITTLITHRHGVSHGPWAEAIEIADRLLAEGGVELIIAAPVHGCAPVRRDGKVWFS